MGRRKRAFDDEDMSDSSDGSDNDDRNDWNDDDPDVRAEKELFEDPYKRKRRRKDGKESALYGVFGEDDDDGGAGRKGLGSRVNMSKYVANSRNQRLIDSFTIL